MNGPRGFFQCSDLLGTRPPNFLGVIPSFFAISIWHELRWYFALAKDRESSNIFFLFSFWHCSVFLRFIRVPQRKLPPIAFAQILSTRHHPLIKSHSVDTQSPFQTEGGLLWLGTRFCLRHNRMLFCISYIENLVLSWSYPTPPHLPLLEPL